jgi:hypothetical protein
VTRRRREAQVREALGGARHRGAPRGVGHRVAGAAVGPASARTARRQASAVSSASGSRTAAPRLARKRAFAVW